MLHKSSAVVFTLLLMPVATPMPIQAQIPAAPEFAAVTLPENTPIHLKLHENLSLGTNRANDRVDFEVLEDIKVGSTIVISRGAIATGTVTDAQPKRMTGNAGKLHVAIDSVQLVDGKTASLSASQSVAGKGHGAAMTIGSAETALLFWPAPPFLLSMQESDVNIPRGTEVTAYVSGDTDVSPPPIDDLQTTTRVYRQQEPA